jgi:hypothetical protein
VPVSGPANERHSKLPLAKFRRARWVNECNGDVTPIEKIAYHSAARRHFLVDTSTFSGVVGRRQII